MATFKYKALAPDGTETKGIIQAIDEMEAAARIKQDYPILVSINAVKEKEDGGLLSMEIGGNKINIKNLSVMCSQIAIALKSGIPLARCLELIGSQTEDKALHKMLVRAAEDVAGGSALTASLVRNSKNLPATFVETIGAGEESGNVERSFEEMAVYYEKQYKTQDKIKSALSYPIFVVVVAIVVLIVVMVFVVPALTKTFDDLGGNLPIITVILITVSTFFQKYWIFMVLAILAFVVIMKLYHRTEQGKISQGKMQLRMPVMGKIRILNASAQFANTMSMLLKSGLTVDRAVDITSKTLDNYLLQQEVGGWTARIQEGRPLGECIRGCDYFPNTLKEMCAIGEETGELDNTLEVIGDFYTNEADLATKEAVAKLEPTMLIFLAVFAGFIVLAIYMPMFTMYNLM